MIHFVLPRVNETPKLSSNHKFSIDAQENFGVLKLHHISVLVRQGNTAQFFVVYFATVEEECINKSRSKQVTF